MKEPPLIDTLNACAENSKLLVHQLTLPVYGVP